MAILSRQESGGSHDERNIFELQNTGSLDPDAGLFDAKKYLDSLRAKRGLISYERRRHVKTKNELNDKLSQEAGELSSDFFQRWHRIAPGLGLQINKSVHQERLYRQHFVKSARFLGTMALNLAGTGEEQFLDALEDDEQRMQVLKQFGKDYRRIAWYLRDSK